MEPEELLAAARDLVRQPRPTTVGIWPRAAALLARQALEEGLHRLWRRSEPDLERVTNMRCQLVCLSLLRSQSLGDRIHQTWLALSHACHHHPYELGPTADELEGWMETVEALLHESHPTAGGRSAPGRQVEAGHRPSGDRGRG